MKRFFNKNNIIKVTIITIILYMWYIPHIPLPLNDAIILIALYLLIQTHIENTSKLKLIKNKNENLQKLLHTIFKHSPDLISYKDINLRYVMCNSAFKKFVGLEIDDEIAGKSDTDVFEKKQADIIRKNDEYVLKGVTISRNSFIKNKHYNIVETPLTSGGEVFGILSIARDITESETLKKELQDKEKNLTSILNSMPMAAYLKDIDGNIIFGNTNAMDFLGISKKNNSGKFLYTEKYREDIVEEDKQVIERKICLSMEKQIKLNNGELHWFNVHKCPVFDTKNNVTGICVLARDVDIEKNAKNQRDTYIATLSHDLKTPTIAQIRALNLLLNEELGSLNDEQKDILNLTKDSCNFMHDMVTTLINTYKFEDGDYIINYSEFNLLELVTTCCEEVDHLMKDKNITAIIRPQPKLPITYADKSKLKNVITNIISNAITYSYENSDIIISLECQGDFVIFKTESKSDYINESLMENIFKKYVTHAEKFNKIGAGLELYLAKQIINAHNGKMFAYNTEEFNVFGFSLPVKISQTKV